MSYKTTLVSFSVVAQFCWPAIGARFPPRIAAPLLPGQISSSGLNTFTFNSLTVQPFKVQHMANIVKLKFPTASKRFGLRSNPGSTGGAEGFSGNLAGWATFRWNLWPWTSTSSSLLKALRNCWWKVSVFKNLAVAGWCAAIHLD